jgi:hypothetical protein
LEEVRLDVERDHRQSLQLGLAREAADGILASVRGGQDLAAAAEQLDIEVREAGPFGLSGEVTGLGRGTPVAAEALALEVGAVGGPTVVGQQAVVFEVTQRTNFETATFEAEREATRERLKTQKVGQLVSSLLAQRREELGVRYDPSLLENFGLAG